jgi:MGT family glycosyltransferase
MGESVATYLLAANPIHGHVGPVLQVARGLVARGHDVTVLTGSRFVGAVGESGAAFRPLLGGADYDDREPATYLPDRGRYAGVRQAEYDIRTIFVETIPDQYRSIVPLIDELRPDAVLVDGAFAGVLPLVARTSDRPPILALGVTPLTQSSRDAAPHGLALPPPRNVAERVRYAAMGLVARHVVFGATQRAGKRAFAAVDARLDSFIMDASRMYDRFLQTGPAALEYPRRDLAPNTAFVGVLPQTAHAAPLPGWWGDLDGRAVVHVTQGTIDNHDFGRLVRPTLDALADRDVLVVVTAGGRDVEAIGALPDNARAARYLPYDALLARTAVMVTNGGFGGVQAALAAGVPLVVAGGTEDKPEVAARVAWTGAGVDLKTGTPDAAAVGAAVDRVLSAPAYRTAAARIAADAASHDPITEIAEELANAVVAPRV